MYKIKTKYFVVKKENGEILEHFDSQNLSNAEIRMKIFLSQYKRVYGKVPEVLLLTREELKTKFGI